MRISSSIDQPWTIYDGQLFYFILQVIDLIVDQDACLLPTYIVVNEVCGYIDHKLS